MNKNSDKKEYEQKILDEKISTIIQQTKDNPSLNFIASKLSNLQSIKVKSKIVGILDSIF